MIEIDAREPGNDNEEKMMLTMPINAEPILRLEHSTVSYLYLVDGEGGKANDSVATSSNEFDGGTIALLLAKMSSMAATFPKSDSPRLFFACSRIKRKLAFVS